MFCESESNLYKCFEWHEYKVHDATSTGYFNMMSSSFESILGREMTMNVHCKQLALNVNTEYNCNIYSIPH